MHGVFPGAELRKLRGKEGYLAQATHWPRITTDGGLQSRHAPIFAGKFFNMMCNRTTSGRDVDYTQRIFFALGVVGPPSE